jgi:arginine repressor
MRNAREATEHTIRLSKLHIAQQETRIERQKELIASLEADGHADTARDARRLLTEMNILLTRMEDDLSLAEKRLADRGEKQEFAK